MRFQATAELNKNFYKTPACIPTLTQILATSPEEPVRLPRTAGRTDGFDGSRCTPPRPFRPRRAARVLDHHPDVPRRLRPEVCTVLARPLLLA